MTNTLKLAVNTSIYDGYDMETALASIKKCGFNYFELAYNQGYVGNLKQDLFGEENAEKINRLKQKYQLSTLALGCTMDLAAENFADIFAPRIYFAESIGAKYLNVCTTTRQKYKQLVANLTSLKPILQQTGCILCLENAGDANFDAFVTLNDGIELLTALDSPHYSINFDPGNMVTYDRNLPVTEQAIQSLNYSRHFHIKDVAVIDHKFEFIPIEGNGLIDYAQIIPAVKQKDLPCSFEIPLRIYRDLDATPRRKASPAALSVIENTLMRSKNYIDSL
ncbi:sugar phosphate isomerase/epimerase family protein [Necropsobacter rosorum]|uniref:sugar phosphate isomerase/epimerase family protein n=1 Tax=Necropsobacter rosorum TaxID=908285 RepID=UPI000509A60C